MEACSLLSVSYRSYAFLDASVVSGKWMRDGIRLSNIAESNGAHVSFFPLRSLKVTWVNPKVISEMVAEDRSTCVSRKYLMKELSTRENVHI